MRILHIINSLEIGGAEKLLVDILPLLKKKEEFTVEVLLLLDSDTFFKQTLEQSGVRIHCINAGSVYDLKNIFMIIPFLKNYNICHVHLFPALYWTAIAKLISFSNVKLIFTEHSTDNRRWKNKMFRMVDKFIYKRYSAVTFITKQVKTAFNNNVGSVSSRLPIIQNGINLQRYNQAKAYNKSEIDKRFTPEDVLVIQISAFRKEKDQDTLIRASTQLPKNYRILLVGEGERKSFCEKLAQELNVSERVLFLGNRSDVPNLLKTCDIAIQSSHWEGFGLAAVESMASGLPVLASNVPGLADVIGNSTLLFNQGNEDELAEKILEITSTDIAYKNAQNYCINRANLYDIKSSVEKLTKLYYDIQKI